ncbi:MAG: phosphatidate cytidylyltransferase [bacterium]|nr:phosphatidate cytidylyltransferase [bacterium]
MPAPKSLLLRTGVAAWGIPLVMASVLLGGWVFSLFVAIMAALALYEFYSLAEMRHFNPQTVPAVMLALISVLLAEFLRPGNWFILMFFLAIFLVWLEMIFGERQAYRDLPLTLFGWAYIPVLLGTLVFVRNILWDDLQPSPGYLIYFLSCIWICDTAAYAGGKLLGKHKLFPAVSPKKTWEGFFAGIIGALLWAWIWVPILADKTSANDLFYVAIIVGIIGQFGDLVESYFKRSAGVKDSGNLLSVHGGVFDRFDSLILSAPCVFLYQVSVGRIALF